MKLIGLYYLYHFVFFLLSLALLRPRIGTPSIFSGNRFAVFVPAHNEENVIAESVRSILAAEYPRELFRVFVIADNCTDNTAKLAHMAGAKVLKRKNQTKRGKQYALDWAFNQINLNQYDAVVVLDADNHIHKGFFSVLDNRLASGNKVIQGYVETKNPSDSWITANYAYMFWYICRLNMIRTYFGLSSWLAGTGLCISTEIIKKVGFKVNTLVDDVEYTCQLILAGEKVTFAPGAVIYDQKPIGLMDSMKQRLRWIRGQTQVTFRYIPKLAAKSLVFWWQGNIKQVLCCIDAILWVPMQLAVLTSFSLSIFLLGPKYILTMLLTVPFFYILPLVAERITSVKSWTYLTTTGAFFFTWIPITFYGVLTYGKKGWWRTPH